MGKKRGFVVILITFTILIMTFISVMGLYKQAFTEYNKVRLRSDYVKAKYHAQSWLAFAVDILKKIPEKQLYMFGIFDGPKPLTYGENIQIMVNITDETGKINVNYLVNTFNDDINFALREMLDRLSESLGIDSNRWDAVVDWIDENNVKMPYGAEQDDYAAMQPPRRIKNSFLHSVDELLLIPGFDSWTLYADRRTEDEKKKYSKDFMTPEELMAISDDDFRLARNITVYMPDTIAGGDWKININSAPYHVILALSEFMTPAAAMAVIVGRIKNGGYFEGTGELAAVAQLHMPTTGKVSLLDEIGTRITFSGRVYKIVVEVSIGSKTARVMGLYDATAKKLISYLE